MRAEDIHSLTDFKRRTLEHLKQLKKSGRARVLTVNGRARLVVQDADAYQRLLDELEQARAIAGIRRGLADDAAGHVVTVDAAFSTLRRKNRVRRAS